MLAFYLGGPKTVKEVGVFSFHCDTRANQDYWVQFRIWHTYNERAGTPARSHVPQGGSVWVEVEVLGAEHDVVVPSPAEIARQQAIRRAPPQPAYVKRPTWRETVIANREALLAWESAQDELALPDSGAVFGPWHVLGPLPRNSQSLPPVEPQKTVDLTKRYAGRDGSELSWQKRADLLDHRLIDDEAAGHALRRLRPAQRQDRVRIQRLRTSRAVHGRRRCRHSAHPGRRRHERTPRHLRPGS